MFPSSGNGESLRKSYIVLQSKNEKNEEKLSELRDKLKEVRGELGSKERQLDSARKLLSRLGAEKSQLELQSDHGKAHTKKLEHRLAQTGDAAELQAKLGQQKLKNEDLRSKVQETEAKLLVAEETVHRSANEINVLKGALGLRSDFPRGSLDNQARLLHQLAQSQEESTSLALQLSEHHRMSRNMSDRLADAGREMERLLQIRLDLETAQREAEQQAQHGIETSGVFRREAEQAKSEMRRLSAVLDEALAAKLSTEQQLRSSEHHASQESKKANQLTDKLGNMERAGRLSIEALRSEVTLAVERAEARSAEQRVAWFVREASLREQCMDLQSAFDAARSQRMELETEALKLRRHIAESEEEMEEQRLKERGHGAEVARMVSQVESLMDLNQALKKEGEVAALAEQLAEAQRMLEAEIRSNSHLQSHIELMQDKLQAEAASENRREEEWHAKVSELHEKLAGVNALNERLQDEVLMARQEVADFAAQAGPLDQHVEELHITIESLTASKSKLQSTMMEQLTQFKAKLIQVEDENRQLRQAATASSRVSPERMSISYMSTALRTMQPTRAATAQPSTTSYKPGYGVEPLSGRLHAREMARGSSGATNISPGRRYDVRMGVAGAGSTSVQPLPSPTSTRSTAMYLRAKTAQFQEGSDEEEEEARKSPGRVRFSDSLHRSARG